jgi:hypothetical protein
MRNLKKNFLDSLVINLPGRYHRLSWQLAGFPLPTAFCQLPKGYFSQVKYGEIRNIVF